MSDQTPNFQTQFRDPASDVVRNMQTEMLRRVGEGWVPETDQVREVTDGQYTSLFTKIHYEWRQEDKNALIQLRAAAENRMADIFGAAINALDQLYMSIRIPKQTERGTTERDERGRIVWETNEDGSFKEDWESISGQDVEKTLLDLQRVRLVTSQRKEDLFLEAVFARHTYDDIWHDSFEQVVEGTQGIRTAVANRKARQEKYAAFFRYYLWRKVDSLDRELKETQRLLERIIDWRIRRK